MSKLPSKLYKYRSLSSERSRERTGEAIANPRLQLSSVADFNDPQEFRFRVGPLMGMTKEDWLELFERRLSCADDRAQARRTLGDLKDPQILARAAERVPAMYREKLERECGVLSLAEAPD